MKFADKSKFAAWNLDLRVRERHLASGVLDPKLVERHLAELPDNAAAAEVIVSPQPAIGVDNGDGRPDE